LPWDSGEKCWVAIMVAVIMEADEATTVAAAIMLQATA
jgi:hypothetical protein